MEKEFSWCHEYGMEKVKAYVGLSSKSIRVYDSCKIRKAKHMKEVINWLKNEEETAEFAKLPIGLLVAEWKTHNLLYNLNISTSRTRHLDIEGEMPFLYKIGYILLSLFYF